MKQPLTTLRCMDKKCAHEVTSHRLMDGLNCEKCGGPTWTFPTSKSCCGLKDEDLPTRFEGSE